MSNLSTDDCKDYLVHVYPNSSRTKWKRVSKYKDDNGLVCRDFNNPSVGDVTLVEVNGSLQLKETQAPSQEPLVIHDNTIVVKSFSKKDMTDAKRLVSRYVNNYGEDEIPEENKGFNAIPSQVLYRFSIIDGDYERLLQDINATGDYNSKLDHFCLEIYPKDGDYNEHMDGLISDFLPENDGEAMECTYEFSYEEPITIKEMVQMMASAGFIYSRNHCFLEPTISKLHFVNEQLEATPSTTIDVKAVFEEAIKTDDAVLLEDVLSAGGSIDFKYKKITPLIYCIQHNHVNCFKTLVKYTENLAKGVKSEGNPIWSLTLSDEVRKYNFDYLTYLLEYGRYDFKKARAVDTQAAMSAMVKRDLFNKYGHILNDKYRSFLTLYMMLGDSHPFEDPYIKENIHDALYKYAKYIHESVYIGAEFTESIIAPELLDMMMDSKFKISEQSLVQRLEMQIELFRKGTRGRRYTAAQITDAITRYTQVIEKLRKS